MIKGARFWDDRDRYYIQTNNPTEEILRKEDGQDWLESCGPTAAVNCLAVLDYNVEIISPGIYRPQPEEVLTDYFNDPRNYKKLKIERGNISPAQIQGNRVPQYYPLAVREVFDAEAHFIWTKAIAEIVKFFEKSCAVQLCLKNPGHYIAGVAYDHATKEIIYNDPWPGFFPDRNGFNRRMNHDEFQMNVKPFAIIYTEGKS